MLGGYLVNIVGPNALQNALLSAFIEKETDADCVIVNSSQINNVVIAFSHKPALTLIDCQSEDSERVLLILSKCRETGPVSQNIALFNVDENSTLEDSVSPPEVHGLFFSNTSKDNFIKGLLAIRNGDLWFPRRVMSNYLLNGNQNGKLYAVASVRNDLTRRELQILNMLTTGAKNIEIAQNLCVSVHTIKTHIYHIYKKIDVNNRMEAVQWAYNNL